MGGGNASGPRSPVSLHRHDLLTMAQHAAKAIALQQPLLNPGRFASGISVICLTVFGGLTIEIVLKDAASVMPSNRLSQETCVVS